ETLFILQRAPLFGTRAGGVFQVIDLPAAGGGWLQNVITFPPEGAFIVDSSLAPAAAGAAGGGQRLDFQFTGAKLNLAGGRALRVPPFPFLAFCHPPRPRVPTCLGCVCCVPRSHTVGCLPTFGPLLLSRRRFDNVYMDDTLRVSCDSRGDTLISLRAGPPRRFT
ncbi:putative plastid-lipid-associated protein 11, chloroplastic, partial [Tetrabaena socialis]